MITRYNSDNWYRSIDNRPHYNSLEIYDFLWFSLFKKAGSLSGGKTFVRQCLSNENRFDLTYKKNEHFPNFSSNDSSSHSTQTRFELEFQIGPIQNLESMLNRTVISVPNINSFIWTGLKSGTFRLGPKEKVEYKKRLEKWNSYIWKTKKMEQFLLNRAIGRVGLVSLTCLFNCFMGISPLEVETYFAAMKTSLA